MDKIPSELFPFNRFEEYYYLQKNVKIVVCFQYMVRRGDITSHSSLQRLMLGLLYDCIRHIFCLKLPILGGIFDQCKGLVSIQHH